MLKLQMASYLLLLLSLLHQNPDFCDSLDAEGSALLRFKERVEVDPYGALSDWGEGTLDPCSWFGVQCSDRGRVVSLNLKDLCLKGTLTPELGKLIHMKSLILSNNSFYGTIPGEIGDLQKLQELNLGHNSLSGPLPYNLGRILSLEILILRSNKCITNISPELHKLNMISELHVDEKLSTNSGTVPWNDKNATIRKLLQVPSNEKGRRYKHGSDHTSGLAPYHTSGLAPSPSPSPSPLPSPLSFRFPPMPQFPPKSPPQVVPPSSAENEPSLPVPESHPRLDAAQPSASVLIPSLSEGPSSLAPTVPSVKHAATWATVMSIGGGVSFLISFAVIYMFCCRADKVVTPWSTGLSGQLQKALVTGVPSLRRSELERACEDFSNIIDTLSDCMLYKGTLSTGVEIAVTSSVITSAKDWSEQSEAKFMKKISMLSNVNHKNFMNLIGYCEEEELFTRMMVFEYTPNGTLFEHLHIKEAEHLNWAARLRIAMGIAYCLQHMHQLDPPAVLKDLHSSSIYLTDDYAAKVSDLGFCSDESGPEPASENPSLADAQPSGPESTVYKFGIILLEIISGRRPFSKDDGLLVLWASSYLTGQRPMAGMVDSTLESFCEEDVSALCEVIRPCIHPDPRERPTMEEVVARLRQITALPPDGATPKLSPLWWAELEIISTEVGS